jgi:type IV pilus assembly protein PilY1
VDADGDNPSTKLRRWESAYFAMDITNPNSPVLLWEFFNPDLSFTMSYPAIAKVGTKWYAVFGSGSRSDYTPDYEGNPNQAAKLFVVDIEDGSLDATFQVQDSPSFFADPVAVDIDFVSTDGTDYDVDAIYVGESYKSASGKWNSRMWRLVTFGDTNPANWKMYNFFNPDSGETIVAAPSLASDELQQQWVYFGTGKYYSEDDKSNTDAQTFYGMKDPCWNPDITNFGWKSPIGTAPGTCPAGSPETAGNPSPSVSKANLINTTGVEVELGGNFKTGKVAGTNQGTSVDSLGEEMVYDSVGNSLSGWYVDLPVAGERSLNKPTVIGGLVLYTTFVPNSDLCGFSGNSFFSVLYFTTGTAFKESVIGCVGGDQNCTSADPIVLSRTESAATGMASSIAIHMGREEGARAYVQLSTGEAASLDIETPPDVRSGIISWRDL